MCCVVSTTTTTITTTYNYYERAALLLLQKGELSVSRAVGEPRFSPEILFQLDKRDKSWLGKEAASKAWHLVGLECDRLSRLSPLKSFQSGALRVDFWHF